MKYTNSYKVSINFTPWFDSGYRFDHIHMYEELGGKLARGEISMVHDGSSAALRLVTDQYTGQITLEKEGGNIYVIDIFIINREYFKNFLTLKFVCIKDKKFYTELLQAEWTDITDAIEALYPGKKDIRCKCDIDNQLEILQNSETNQSLCTKLSYGFKKKSVFAYGWEGYMIKEIVGIDSGGHQEPYYQITGSAEFHQIDSYNLNYYKEIYYTPTNPWEPLKGGENNREQANNSSEDYTDRQPKNSRTLQMYEEYTIVGKDFEQLMHNYWDNQKYMSTTLFTSFRIKDFNIPVYKIGDILKYRREEQKTQLPFTLFLVKSNELFMAIEDSEAVGPDGENFSWTSMLQGIEEKGEVLPIVDPTNT